MKKTKILLVLAIAMLAMFAMSACGIIAQGVESVEFEVMPKNYFAVDDFAGISVKFNVKIAGTTYTVDETYDGSEVWNNKVITVAGYDVPVTVTGYPTEKEMGDYKITVTASGFSTEYEIRLCKAVGTLEALQAAGKNGGYYILTTDVESAAGSGKSVLNVTATPFVLYGEGHTISNTSKVNDANAVITVGAYTQDMREEMKQALKKGYFEFNNVKALGGLKGDDPTKDTSHYPNRGMNFDCLEGAIVNINACEISGLYAIRFVRCENVTVNISNGTTASGWAALYTFANNSVFNIDDVTLSGTNYYSGASNDFGTIVVDGDAWDWNKDGTPDNAPGTLGSNNVINVTNCVITNTTNTECNQYLVVANPGAAKNVINLVGCTDANGKALVLVKNLVDFCDNVGSVIYKDGKNVYDMKALDATMRNKLYIDGQLYDVDDITAINK